MYGYICPNCGDHLDPGEKCDCKKEREEKMRKRLARNRTMEELLEVDEWKQEELKICY